MSAPPTPSVADRDQLITVKFSAVDMAMTKRRGLKFLDLNGVRAALFTWADDINRCNGHEAGSEALRIAARLLGQVT